MRATAATAAAILTVAWCAVETAAQTTTRPETGEGTATQAPEYPGVVPGAGHPPPAERRVPRRGRAVVTWPGFELTESGSRVFVQSTRALEWSREDGAERIVVTLRNARIHLRNNLNPLVTEHFPQTPVASADLVRRGRDLNLIIALKVAATARIHGETQHDGYYYLFVEFPAGAYLTPPSDLPAGEAVGTIATDLGGSQAIRRGRGGSRGEGAAGEGQAAPPPAPVEAAPPAPTGGP